MSVYVGVDYGTSMLKAAACSSPPAEPRLLNLAGHNRFLPVAVRLGSAGGMTTGWDAYRRRRAALRETAFGFRDRISAHGSSLALGNETLDAVAVQDRLFADLRQAAQDDAGDIAAAAFAVPDDWFAPRWSLPIAVAKSHWSPALFVRDWMAALAMHAGERKQHIILVSLGAGAARATLCSYQGGGWQRVGSIRSDEISATVLRSRLSQRIAERVVQQMRRDPREQGDADQAMCDGIDRALVDLHDRPATTLQATLFGEDFRDGLSRDDLTALGASFQSPLETMVGQLIADASLVPATAPVVVWGELAQLLPIAEWLARFLPPRRRADILPSDALALGAAKLCAWWVAEGKVAHEEGYGGLCLQCGGYAPRLSQSACDECGSRLVPLAEQLEGSAPLLQFQPRACLVLDSDGGPSERREIAGNTFRLGRHQMSEWVFSEQTYPTVSSAHAVVFWDGERYRLSDLGSTNETYVNDVSVDECSLNDGDIIKLGRKGPKLKFEVLD